MQLSNIQILNKFSTSINKLIIKKILFFLKIFKSNLNFNKGCPLGENESWLFYSYNKINATKLNLFFNEEIKFQLNRELIIQRNKMHGYLYFK